MKITCVLAVTLLSAFSFTSARAGDTIDFKGAKDYRPIIRDFPFERGASEVQVLVGPMFSLNNGGDKRPAVNDVTLAVRYGLMLNTASGSGPLRGNFELLVEAFASDIYDGPGDGILGASLLLRYNFVQPQAKFVPYVQLGGGGAYSDVSLEDSRQRLLGSDFSFNLQASLGARYMFSERFALSFEALYRHISNADSADRNLGLNQIGGLVGISLFF